MADSSISQTSANPSPYFQNQFQSQYNTALQSNDQNYQNILSNYQQNQANTAGIVGGVSQGYGALNQGVQQTIAGIGASQSQAIQDEYAKQAGGLAQSTINSGLGNTTIASQLQRAPQLDAAKAQVALSNQMAQLSAGYQAQLGGAGLQAQMSGAGLQAQTGNTQGSNLSNFRTTPYPGYPPLGNQTSQTSGGAPRISGGGGGSSGTNGLWAAGSNQQQPGLSSYFPAQGINPATVFPNQAGGSPVQIGLGQAAPGLVGGGYGAGLLGGGASTQVIGSMVGSAASGAGGAGVADLGDYFGDLGD